MALLRRLEVKTLVLFLGLTLLSCGAYAIRGVKKTPPGKIVFNVIKFGARPDGKSNSAEAFMKTWKRACTSKNNSTVLIPRGEYMTSNVKFHGPCANKMTLEVQGSVLADTDSGNFTNNVWFTFQSIDGLVIKGKGTFDTVDVLGSAFIFQQVHNIDIDRMTSRNSQGTHIRIENSTDMAFRNVHIVGPLSCSKTLSPLDCSKTTTIDANVSEHILVVSGYIVSAGSCASGDADMDTRSVTCQH